MVEDQGLDPKVSYVLGKNNTLVPKKKKLELKSEDSVKEVIEKIEIKEELVASEKEETVEKEKVETADEQVSTQKKKSSFKKKKIETTDE